MLFFDRNPDVLEWNSEEIIIPYFSPLDGKAHRYFPDFWIKVKTKTGVLAEHLIEVKPHDQTIAPKKLVDGKKPTKRYLEEVETYIRNRAKWQASEAYCKKRDLTFQILTEKNSGFL